MSIDDYNRHIQNITDAKTLDELEVAYNNAFIDISLEDPEYLTVLDTTKQARELALNINTSAARGNLQVGEYLLSKSPIFGIVENEIVVVTKITKTGKVTVSQVEDITNGKPMQKKYTQEEIERSFTKTNPVALAQEEDEEANIVDTEQEENIEISKSSLEDFSKNPDLIDKAKQNAASMSKKDRLAALKNASKDDNINNCKPKS
jgi:translation elongation factor P/translation initiation factor 5A